MKDVKIVTARDLKKLYAVKTMLDDLLEGTDVPRRTRRRKRTAVEAVETPPNIEGAAPAERGQKRKRKRAKKKAVAAPSEPQSTEAAG